MPVQLDEDTFCQFIYDPDYLRDDKESITPPEKCLLPFMKKFHQEPIVLDGGNVVVSRNKVILTEKIYTENPNFPQPRLLQRLKEVFGVQCIIIEKEKCDPVGHSDSVVRFIDEKRVLINDYTQIDPAYEKKLRNLLKQSGLMVESLPMFLEEEYCRPGEIPSAVGLYLNYLRVGDVVVMPAFGRPEDQVAVETMRGVLRVLPNATVLQVPCRSLAEEGGVLNCISWAIKRSPPS
jgi:agmatine deiminase